MVDLSWVQVAVAIAGSGGATALVTEGFRIRERRYATEAQERERRDQAHAAARDRYLPDVSKAVEYLDYWGNEEYGLELGDYMVFHRQTPDFHSVGEVVASLKQVAREHPTRAVRSIAGTFASSVDRACGSVHPERAADDAPSVDEFIEWDKLGDQLLEAMHV